MSCNGILTKSESVCYSCGESAPGGAKSKGKGQGTGLNAVVNVVFFMSLGLTVFSFFSDKAPPLALCIPVSLVLLFVKSSADQVKKNRT